MWKELIDVDLLCVREWMIYDSLVAFSSEISLHISHLIVHTKKKERRARWRGGRRGKGEDRVGAW